MAFWQAQTGDPDVEPRVQFWAGVILMSFGIVAVAAMAFLPERNWGSEEPTLLNVPYTFEHYSQVAFPVYAYNNPPSFHRLFLHPPTHYVSVGLFLKAGLSLYYAEAMPAVILATLCMALILTARFPAYVTLGWMAGFISGMGWMATVGSGDYSFHLRPDAHMALASIASLLVMENARARNWDGKWLFAGAFLFVYASTVHYSGLFGWLGVTVYVLLVWRAFPLREFFKRLAWIAGGGALIGLPYLLLHVLRNWIYIKPWMTYADPQGKVSQTIQANFSNYQGIAVFVSRWRWPDMFYAFPLERAFAWMVPPFAVALVLLALHKSTRAMVIAGLPVPLYLFFVFRRKLASYLYLESFLLLAGVWILVALLWMTISARLFGKWRFLSAPIFVAFFAVGFSVTTPALKGLTWDLEPRRHELTVARAAAKEVVGHDALTASIHPWWYLSGGRMWYDLTGDLFVRQPAEDAARFWSRFDAIAVAGPAPWGTQTGWTEAELYRKGIIHLLGFENLRGGNWARWVWLSGRDRRPVTGFFWKDNEYRRFTESGGGDSAVVSVVFPGTYAEAMGFSQKLHALEYWPLDLPRKSGDAGWVLVLLFEAGKYHGLPDGYQPLDVIRGRTEAVDIAALLRGFDEKKDLIEFEESYPELLRHFAQPKGNPIHFYWHDNLPEMKIDSQDGEATVDAKPGAQGLTITSEGTGLQPDTWYKASFEFKHGAGNIVINLMRDGTPEPLVSLWREVPQSMTPESFIFHEPPGTANTYLKIAAYPVSPTSRVQFAVKPVELVPVELSR